MDGTSVRDRYAFGDRFVFGFIGTFGPWHGAEVLASAFAELLRTRPALRQHVGLFMIGDGPGVTAVRHILSKERVDDAAWLAGRVHQADGPAHLAACDALISPHVPNVDGSRFFGSPTKLFEYMATGKPIVASRLEQIGDVLEDGVTGILVGPGDVSELATAMGRVFDDRHLQARLGVAARLAAESRHSWREHTRRIVDGLADRCA